MTLLFDDTKALEKAVGEEAARAILHIVEAAKEEALTKGDLAEVASVIREDILRLEGKMDTRFAEAQGKADKLAMQVKLLIVLALLAIAMFSPNLAALMKLAK
ncbi:MAG TPA: hypothetical protein PKC79_09390 [Solidesulfovibrio magneticus]|nr:hypothetical protein [Solidesulfovibrio magneticus]